MIEQIDLQFQLGTFSQAVGFGEEAVFIEGFCFIVEGSVHSLFCYCWEGIINQIMIFEMLVEIINKNSRISMR